MVRQPFIIRIEKGNVFSRALPQAGVARDGAAPIFLANDLQAGVHSRNQCRRIVYRSIVHDDQLPVADRLRLDASDSAPDRIGAIEGRHDYRNQRHILHLAHTVLWLINCCARRNIRRP